MNGGVVQWIFRLRNTHESGRLLKSKCADPADIFDLFAACKDPVTFPAFYNVPGNPPAESGDMRKQRSACRIEIYSHLVDAAFHHIIERLRQLVLVDIVLVQPDPD